MLNVSNYSLFSVADGAISHTMSYDQFQTFLVHGILFDPGFVIADAYFFSSDHLRRHLTEGAEHGLSLFEAAIKGGVVVPAFRSEVRDFTELLKSLKHLEIQGPFSQGEEIAYRLSASIGPDASVITWPENVGVRYADLLRQAFSGPEPSGLEAGLWRLTERLRTDALELGHVLSAQRSGVDPGIRRGDLVRAVGSVLGVVDVRDRTLVNQYEILSRVAATAGPGSPDHRAARCYFDWIDELHRMNYAQSFGVHPGLTGSGLRDFPIYQRALRLDVHADNLPTDSLTATVKIPSTRRLIALPPRQLIDLRDYGLQWRSAALEFLASPNDSTRHAAEAALEGYGKKLRRTAPAPASTDLTVRALALKAAPVLASTATGVVLPDAAPYLVTAAGTGYLAYQYLIRGRHQKARVHLRTDLSIYRP